MQAVNSLRLVLGTMLDITEDDQELAFDPNDPERPDGGAVRLSRWPARRNRRRAARLGGERAIVAGSTVFLSEGMTTSIAR